MSDVKVNVYTTVGAHVGYFLNPHVQAFPEGDYELSGDFYDIDGQRLSKIEFNPQALPYVADISAVSGLAHKKLESVYVQRGRQPVRMTGNAGIQ
jgi:hypothetical protein